MQAIETFAIFDNNGKMTIENFPSLKNAKVKLLFLIEENEANDFYKFSAKALANAYSYNEPWYKLSNIKEVN